MASSSNLLVVHLRRCFSPPSFRSYLAELIASFINVFIAVGSDISARMLTPGDGTSSLLATAAAQAIGLSVAVLTAADVSGGHVNPAVTLAFAIGGYIGVRTAIFYWASQLLGSTLACAMLSAVQEVPVPTTPTTAMALTVVCGGEEILEGVLAFLLVYTAQVALDPRPHQQGGKRGFAATALGALALGLAAGACVLSEGSLTSATSMNPARSFGAAVVTGDFKNQAVYWAVPMIGAAVAAAAYHVVACPMSGARPPESRDGNQEFVVEV